MRIDDKLKITSYYWAIVKIRQAWRSPIPVEMTALKYFKQRFNI